MNSQPNKYNESGDFVQAPYQFETKKQKDKLNIYMGREGTVFSNGAPRKLLLKKNIHILPDNSKLNIIYQLSNLENEPIELWFAVEFNIALLAGNAPDRYYYFPAKKLENPILASTGIVENINKMGLKDEWLKLNISFHFDKPTNIWRFPIETISQSEGGFEKVYQSSVVLPNWKIILQPQKTWKVTIIQNITDM